MIKKIATAILLVSLSTSTFAATADGTVGATSSGTLDVTLTLTDQVQVTGFIVMTFTPTSLTTDQTSNDDLCVYRNNSGTYSVNISGNYTSGGVAGSDFYVKNSSDLTVVAYTVDWNDVSGTTGSAPVTANTSLTGQSGVNTTSTDCSSHGSDNANLQVTFSSAALQAAASGTYNGIITVEITPE